MPLVLSKETTSIKGLRARQEKPPLPLQPEDLQEPKKGEYVKLDLRSNPTDENSETFAVDVRFFDSGTPRQWINWCKDFEKVILGHNLHTGPSKYNMAQTLL